jgi:hypothetical protein
MMAVLKMETITLDIRVALILGATGFGLELLALYLLGENMPFNALVAHFVAGLSTAYSLSQLMPQHFRTKSSVFFLFFICLLVPIVSGICLLFSLVAGLYNPKSVKNRIFDRVDPAVNRIESIDSEFSSNLSSGYIRGILRFCPQQEKRIKAVLATRQMTDEMAVPILAVALLDAADEVRLLAYSMLDSKRKKLDRLIHKGLIKLKSFNLQPESKKIIHQNLTEAFWELSYLELVEGQNKQRALNSAKQHVLDALELQQEDACVHLLHARINIKLGLYEKAQYALKLSKKYGMAARKLAPLYAEIAFETRHFDEIGRQLTYIDPMAQKNAILGGWVEQWS